MSKAAFDQVAEGLNEALAIARGFVAPYKQHFLAEIELTTFVAKADQSPSVSRSTTGSTSARV
jgi:putative transcriptional regulator